MVVLLVLAALAQAPTDRVALESLRDSLGTIGDSLALKRVESTTIEYAKQHRDDPLVHLRLGFIAHRLGDITRNKSHYDDAAGEFEWASELHPEWPYPWYGLGLSELAMGENSSIAIENIRQAFGKDYLSKAAKAFARATVADPSFASAVVDLANTALSQRIRPRLDVALSAVRLAAASNASTHPDVQLVRGRVEREAGETDSALAAFQAYLDARGDSGVGLLEIARTSYLAHRPREGWSAYFSGIRAATSPAAIALYRSDISWIADSADLKVYDTLSTPGERAAWLDDFWNRRDVADARDVGERLAEHYRRWFYARHNFRLVSRHRHYDITEVYRPKQSEFDDRGMIYIRHGEPDRRARFLCREPEEPNGEGCASNESWLYHRREGDLVFHFVARGDVQDYKLVESLADVLGFRRAVRAGSFMDPEVPALYQSRDEFGPLYDRVARSQHPAGTELAEDRIQGRRNITLGTTSDSYAQRFDQLLDVVANAFVLGAETSTGGGRDADTAGGEMLHVVFAIPGERLTPERVADGVRYPLRFRLIVSDSSDHVVARLDTLRVFGAHQALHNPSYLTGRLAVRLEPGQYRYRLLVTSLDGTEGDLVFDRLHVDNLDARASRFAVSDVVVGRSGSGLTWVPPSGDTIWLNPLNRFPEGSAAELYYEVYGLRTGATYHTVVRLEKEGGRSIFAAIRGLFGGGRSPVLLEFDAPADGPITRVHRGIALRDVSKGNYRLTLVLTDPASGARVTRIQRFQVVAR
jgi:GWxTD domain-containing protein